MTDNTSIICDSVDFDVLADAVDLALSNDEQEWLNSMSNTPGRGIRREYHFCGKRLMASDVCYGAANTGSISIRGNLSEWPDEFGTRIIPAQFVENLILENYKSFNVKTIESMTLNEYSIAYNEVSIQADAMMLESWAEADGVSRFAFSMNLARLAVAEINSGATTGEVIDYSDMLPKHNEVRMKVVTGPFETMKRVSDFLNNSGVGRICRFVTNKNLMAKGLDHDTSKEQLKSVLKSRYRMVEWCSQAESFLPVSVFAHHKECLCKNCEYEHYTKISKRL